MKRDAPWAGDHDDPRALALAQARQKRLAQRAPYDTWEDLTQRQRTARITAAAEWIDAAFHADLLPAKHQPAPRMQQFTAIESFLNARWKEIDAATRDGAVIPWPVLRAATMLRDRIMENLITVGLALNGLPEQDLKPSWSPRAQDAWADTLRCAEQFRTHDDYAPETWTP